MKMFWEGKTKTSKDDKKKAEILKSIGEAFEIFDNAHLKDKLMCILIMQQAQILAGEEAV